MTSDSRAILAILDECCESYDFPILDNGYVYLAATRLSLFRSATDWAMVIEVFGFSPRSGLPDTTIQTFASRLRDRNPPERFVSRDAYEMYLRNNPHNEFRSAFPIEEGEWQDAEDLELLSSAASEVSVRGRRIPLPKLSDYADRGIELEESPNVQVFELCRYLAEINREQVLATPEEQRVSVLSEMMCVLQLDEWNHPNLVEDERPSGSETFQQLAEVLVSGDVTRYQPTLPPNTHWSNWPDGGRL